MHVQFYTTEIHDLTPEAGLLATVPDPPTKLALDLHIRPDGRRDPAMTLHDTTDAGAGRTCSQCSTRRVTPRSRSSLRSSGCWTTASTPLARSSSR